MLKVEHLQKRYKQFSLNCSLEIKSGYVTGLIGQTVPEKVQHLRLF